MTAERGQSFAPGAVIGIFGGGQLGRMTALAAAELGYRTHIFTPETDSPASHVSQRTTVAAYTDKTALQEFASAIDVATFEFENVPAESIAAIDGTVPVRPKAAVLRICQDRLVEKSFVRDQGIGTTPFAEVSSRGDLERALKEIGAPAVLKTRRQGYDGKGQVKVPARSDASFASAMAEAAKTAETAPCILEAFVEFACEVSVVVARGTGGDVAAYDTVENEHVHHILDRTIAPARIAPELAKEAQTIARTLAERIDLIGVLAVEMFVTKDGRVLVNEMAPRPHNSGHWTIDACTTSQFEQHVRAVCGLPLGPTDRLANAEMRNLIGADVERWREIVAEPGAKLHLYGKTETRPGRKMGHVTRLFPLT